MEHYDAQAKYADMLFKGLDIPTFRHPIKKFKAFKEAEKFRDSHRKCCEWANDTDV